MNRQSDKKCHSLEGESRLYPFSKGNGLVYHVILKMSLTIPLWAKIKLRISNDGKNDDRY